MNGTQKSIVHYDVFEFSHSLFNHDKYVACSALWFGKRNRLSHVHVDTSLPVYTNLGWKA